MRAYIDILNEALDLIVYHGGSKAEPHDRMFFSTEREFAEAYGAVREYRINLGNCFDTLDGQAVLKYLPLEDPYDGTMINDVGDYMGHTSDTWEIMEQVANSIASDGYDSMVVYEGGVRNFFVFHKSNIELLPNSVMEAFDSALPFHWQHWSDDTAVEITADFQIGEGHFVVMFKEKYYQRGLWDISFRRNGTLDLTGTGNAAAVLSTVMRITREFISTQDPRMIEYSAKNEEASRNKLYPKLMAMLMREFPQYVSSNPKYLRTYTSYQLERPGKAYVAPEPVEPEPQPEPKQVSPEEWDEIEQWLNDTKKKRGVNESAGRLGDFVAVKTNDPNANFWMERRGGIDTVGRPMREFSPYAFGITVTATDRLDANYLYYMMEHIWRMGVWRGIATGSTKLVNITAKDVRDYPIG